MKTKAAPVEPKKNGPKKKRVGELQRRALDACKRAESAKKEARDAKHRARESRRLFKEAKKVAKKARAELAVLSKKLKKLLGSVRPGAGRRGVKAKRKSGAKRKHRAA